jgi:hypothetical protein
MVYTYPSVRVKRGLGAWPSHELSTQLQSQAWFECVIGHTGQMLVGVRHTPWLDLGGIQRVEARLAPWLDLGGKMALGVSHTPWLDLGGKGYSRGWG